MSQTSRIRKPTFTALQVAADLPKVEVALGDLPGIDYEYWFDQLERPAVWTVVRHFRRMSHVDPSYPVILEPGNRVVDDMHLVAGRSSKARRRSGSGDSRELPEPDYRGCRPDELPD